VKIFTSDCEGPISKNDNAFEIVSHFVPNGSNLFTVISSYDDVLADVLKKKNYPSGGTLKLILPFLMAYNVTDEKIRRFSSQNIRLVKKIKYTLDFVRTNSNAFIISTSFEHYIRVLCYLLDFPYKNTYCTKLDLAKYIISEKEKDKLKKLGKEIANMSPIKIPSGATSLNSFTYIDKCSIVRLNEIFWDALAKLDSNQILSDVNPIGGYEKASAIEASIRKSNSDFSDVIYFGDSITDTEAFREVSNNGGLAVSFNGNEHALKNADIAVLSRDGIVIAVLSDLFFKNGKNKVMKIIENWNIETLRKNSLNLGLLNLFLTFHPVKLPKTKKIDKTNIEILIKESEEFRKKFRGESIGRLG